MRLKNNIIIYGLKHSGKTLVGKTLAKELGVQFYDTDEIIEQLENKSVQELYKTGEFSKSEVRAVNEIISEPRTKIISMEPDYKVISTGGGICDNTVATSLLAHNGVTVFLDVDINLLVDRIYNEYPNLPVFLKDLPDEPTWSDVRDKLYPIFIERRKKYLELSKFVLTRTNRLPIDVEDLQNILAEYIIP